MSMAYESWALRYVPDPVRGEFVNVGVIVGYDGGDWAIRHINSFARASRLGGNPSLLRPVLAGLAERVAAANGRGRRQYGGFQELDSASPLSRHAIMALAARYNNALQISQPMPAYGENAASVADILYSHLVMETVRESQTRARTQMVRDFKSAIERTWERDSEVPLLRNPRVRIGRQRQGFDFALHDGGVEQMTQVISINRKDLDLVATEIRAWNFSVSLLRNEGGEIERTDERAALRVPAEIPIIMLHDEPRGEREREVLSIARDGWERLGVKDFANKDMGLAASQALSLVS